jgi:hypothetical protein
MNEKSEILMRARELYNTASRGLEDARADPSRRVTGLHNAVVFGRAVTNVLENLRSKDSRFDGWYGPVSAGLSADPLMKYFYKLRSQILKQGNTGTGMYAHIQSFSPSTDMMKFGAPPPNARSFFIGDSNGGTGWEVEVTGGATEKFYAALPPEIGIAGLYFRDAPGADNTSPPELDAITLTTRYLSRMKEVLESAEAFFK